LYLYGLDSSCLDNYVEHTYKHICTPALHFLKYKKKQIRLTAEIEKSNDHLKFIENLLGPEEICQQEEVVTAAA